MKDFGQDDGTVGFGGIAADTARFNASTAFFTPSATAAVSGLALHEPKPRVTQPLASKSVVYQTVGKRMLDIALVILTAPITLPVVILCAIALWIEGGSPFYSQDRLGKGGGRFSILKLRTMVQNADQHLADVLAKDPAMKHEWDTTQKLKKDPRVTPLGATLRATSLDELPQLWNVLKGEMSLVGPRPMLPEQLSMYGPAEAYFAMKPGITGIWQVSARNENHFAYRAEIDAVYCAGVSAWGDVVLMAKTVGVVLKRTGY
ncbi:MAG: sugar transferase [Sedimentitalea sp.]